MNNQDIIDFIISKLVLYPSVKFEKDRGNLVIYANKEDGLDLLLETGTEENTLYFGEGFHCHFAPNKEETDQMLDWTIYGLTGFARLKEFSKKGKAYKWILQIKDNNNIWHDKGSMGSFNFNFWTKTTINYYQNDYMPIEIFDKQI